MYAQALWYETTQHVEVFNALEVFHDFILSHDDIIDQDEMRWGKPTIHTMLQYAYPNLKIENREHFWESLAMIGGDVLHAIAQAYVLDADLQDHTKLVLLKTMNEAMLDVAQWRYKQFLSDNMNISDVSLEYITEHNLWQVTWSYTFLFPLKFGHAIAKWQTTIDPLMVELCRYVGIVFQTWDDMIGLFGDPKISGKSNDGDISQGKKTIPIYFTYQYANSQQKILLDDLVGKKSLTSTEAQIVKSIVKECGLSHTMDFMETYANKSLKLVEQLDYVDSYKQWRKEFITYLLTRKS